MFFMIYKLQWENKNQCGFDLYSKVADPFAKEQPIGHVNKVFTSPLISEHPCQNIKCQHWLGVDQTIFECGLIPGT